MDTVFSLEPVEVFTKVSEEIITNLYNPKQISDVNLELHTIESAKDDVKKIISNSNYDMAKVAESLQSKNWNLDRVNSFISILDKRKSELLYGALIDHHSSYGETVTDFNWLLKLVFGTNDLKTLRYPLLQLLLSTVDSNGEPNRRVYDINKEMLAKIISVLESIDEIK